MKLHLDEAPNIGNPKPAAFWNPKRTMMLKVTVKNPFKVPGAFLPVDGGLTAGVRGSDWEAVTVPLKARPLRATGEASEETRDDA